MEGYPYEETVKDRRSAACRRNGYGDAHRLYRWRQHWQQSERGFGGYRFVLDGKVKGKDKEYLTVLVAANFSYNDTLLGVILDEISKKVKTDADVNINQNGTWTDIGVVVKSDPKTKQSYMAIAFKVKNPNKK